jgi:excisionase family DNA binding protein
MVQVSEELLSSAEAARVLGVSPASVKRWADAGTLACLKTAGHHRRFRRDDLERFRQLAGALSTASAPVTLGDRHAAAWADELLRPQPAWALEAALMGARAELGSWWRLCERLGPALEELGARWARGDITVVDEHQASERLARALARVGDWLPVGPRAPCCLLATASGDEHTLGLSLVELCLRERGWRTVWIGRSAPADEIADAVAQLDVRLVALSASSFSSQARALLRQAERMGAACADVGVQLVLGGSGAWPERPSYGHRVRALGAFSELVAAASAT